jgi:hypothetical protein
MTNNIALGDISQAVDVGLVAIDDVPVDVNSPIHFRRAFVQFPVLRFQVLYLIVEIFDNFLPSGRQETFL